MSLYAISDLHLYLSMPDKPMDVFGAKWDNHMDRLNDNCSSVKKDDMLLIAGDISWATYLGDALRDFEFINNIAGKKIIVKGNHDYWWTTMGKLQKYKQENNLLSIDFLHNNFFMYKDTAICGTRGWVTPESDGFNGKDKKIFARELIRLELSLSSAKTTRHEDTVVMLHYPPSTSNGDVNEYIMDLLVNYGVSRCIYGHIHTNNTNHITGVCRGIEFNNVACNLLNFTPLKILD